MELRKTTDAQSRKHLIERVETPFHNKREACACCVSFLKAAVIFKYCYDRVNNTGIVNDG